MTETESNLARCWGGVFCWLGRCGLLCFGDASGVVVSGPACSRSTQLRINKIFSLNRTEGGANEICFVGWVVHD